MKNFLAATLALVMLFSLTACSSNTDAKSSVNLSETTSSQQSSSNNSGDANDKAEPTLSNTRIKMTVNGKEIIVAMYSNPTSQDFVSLLPLTLPFEDWHKIQTISHPPRTLSASNSSGYAAKKGDLTYYTHCDNLGIFYLDQNYKEGLIPLGRIESGVELLAEMVNNVKVTIERIN